MSAKNCVLLCVPQAGPNDEFFQSFKDLVKAKIPFTVQSSGGSFWNVMSDPTGSEYVSICEIHSGEGKTVALPKGLWD